MWFLNAHILANGPYGCLLQAPCIRYCCCDKIPWVRQLIQEGVGWWLQKDRSPSWQGGTAADGRSRMLREQTGNQDKTIILEACPQGQTSTSKASLLKGSRTSSSSATYWRPNVSLPSQAFAGCFSNYHILQWFFSLRSFILAGLKCWESWFNQDICQIFLHF